MLLFVQIEAKKHSRESSIRSSTSRPAASSGELHKLQQDEHQVLGYTGMKSWDLALHICSANIYDAFLHKIHAFKQYWLQFDMEDYNGSPMLGNATPLSSCQSQICVTKPVSVPEPHKLYV